MADKALYFVLEKWENTKSEKVTYMSSINYGLNCQNVYNISDGKKKNTVLGGFTLLRF
jgi:hypothetical protein